jgi:hypothetical protein
MKYIILAVAAPCVFALFVGQAAWFFLKGLVMYLGHASVDGLAIALEGTHGAIHDVACVLGCFGLTPADKINKEAR